MTETRTKPAAKTKPRAEIDAAILKLHREIAERKKQLIDLRQLRREARKVTP